MSEKKRQKKDGERKEKKTKARRDSENQREQRASSPQAARDASNLTDTEPGAGDRARKRGGGGNR